MNDQKRSEFHSPYRDKLGEIEDGRIIKATGKRFLEWTFKAKGLGDPIFVEVYLLKSDSGFTFRATTPKLPDPIQSSDLNALHARVEDALIKQIESAGSIVWEDWFEIIVKGANASFGEGLSLSSAMGVSLHIQVNKIKRGMHPVHKRAVTLNEKGIMTRFPGPSSMHPAGATAQQRLIQADVPEERSYVKDTPVNRLALKRLVKRVSFWRLNLAEILHQEGIQSRLDDLDMQFSRFEES